MDFKILFVHFWKMLNLMFTATAALSSYHLWVTVNDLWIKWKGLLNVWVFWIIIKLLSNSNWFQYVDEDFSARWDTFSIPSTHAMASFQPPTHGTDVDKKRSNIFFLIQGFTFSFMVHILSSSIFTRTRLSSFFFNKPLLQFLQTLCSLKILVWLLSISWAAPGCYAVKAEMVHFGLTLKS